MSRESRRTTGTWRWSDHALSNLRDRHIDRQDAERVLERPTTVAEGRWGRKLLMGVCLDRDLGERMLLRIVVEEGDEETVVVTLYKTSRIGKYLPGAGQGEEP